MIKRERLKEMIKNNEKIYIITNLKLSEQGELSSTSNRYIQDYAGLDFATDLIKSISNFSECYFETKEDAELKLIYGDITRTEILKLPTWEELKEQEVFTFYGKDRNNYDICLWHNMETDEPSTITIELVDNIGSTKVFEIDASEENYIKVCKKAKELFLEE